MLIREFATIPAVDVLDGRAVRLLRGDYDRVEVEAGDPLALVRQVHPLLEGVVLRDQLDARD